MKKTIFTFILLMTGILYASAQNTILEPDGTYLYERSDTCDLFLDVYNPAKGSETTLMGKEKPAVIFMFGGGFIGGTRDDADYHRWFRLMTENGYRVISIDYRLGLKGSDKVGVAQVNVLDKAIHMAVEDLFSATNFIIENSSELAWLAAAVNGTLQQTKAEETAPQTFAGKTFVLNTDVDLDGQEWTPIGNIANQFQGTFDGNNKTISNLVITGNKSDVCLFGMTTNGEIKNLTVNNAKVSGYLDVAVVAGTPYTS